MSEKWSYFIRIVADAWGLAAPLWISAGGDLLAFVFTLFLKETVLAKAQMNEKINNAV